MPIPLRRILAVAVYVAIVLISWNFSSVTGNAGAGDVGRQIAEKARSSSRASITDACFRLLTDWSAATIRSRVAFEYPTAIAFRLHARTQLRRYAAGDCPTGGLLIAGRLANTRAIEIREEMGLARADLGSTVW